MMQTEVVAPAMLELYREAQGQEPAAEEAPCVHCGELERNHRNTDGGRGTFCNVTTTGRGEVPRYTPYLMS